VKGIVDERDRALITISVGRAGDSPFEDVLAWIDTAFDGHLVFSTGLIRRLSLEPLAETEAILADGSKVPLETFLCFIDWFGQRIPVQVIGNEGKFPLLGTALLTNRELSISYVKKELRLD
jgi:clan AA aspartic protease